ncbi:hypothetical protein EDD42_3112 [Plantibacter flavus]|uniref:Uncharacterized protein n=1 Tax=Plantibacter flavus TaxID=150123 RepID=A0A3N2C6G4_9MICO|nr:hypothetical protein EDD42_3112 [Plantibacter flavus]
MGLLALTACTASEPAPAPSRTPPVFENEEQALAAVTETYQEFLDISNTILVEGGVDVDRINAIVGGQLVDAEHENLTELSTQGLSLTGAPTLVSMQLQEWYPQPDAAGVIALARACMDLTAVQVLDGDGNSVVETDRPSTRTWSIAIGPGNEGQQRFVLTSRDFLSEGSSCEN